MEEFAKQFLGFFILWTPYFWETADDRKGDHNNRIDMIIRGALMATVAGLNATLNEPTLWFFVKSLVMSIAILFMFFDYTIAFLLIKNKIIELKGAIWFTYMSKVKQVDRRFSALSPVARLVLRSVVFVAALIWYWS